VDNVREKFRREDATVISVAMLKVELDEKEEIHDRVIERSQRPSWLIFIIQTLFDVFLPTVVRGYAIKVLLFK
jgi:hypothetical protein